MTVAETTVAETGVLSETCDAAVVGGGPAGLSAATRLRQKGLERVVILERESAAGGIPRHCGHSPFGMREFHRCLTGPRYAAKLAEKALDSGVEIRTGTTVVSALPGGSLILSDRQGQAELKARRVILATGVRETPRAARLVGGTRPLGILTTGALQAMVQLKGRVPFRRPLIVGSELVSFSALLTCRQARMKPVAMLEERKGITARAFLRILPTFLGVPLLLGNKLEAIHGKVRVEGVTLSDADGRYKELACDGVVFTGLFTPESTLVRMGHLALDPATGGPAVDARGRCSDPAYFAAGNLLRPVETAGWCWQEGRTIADFVLESMGRPEAAEEANLKLRLQSPALRFALPQSISPEANGKSLDHIQLRFQECARGRLRVLQNGKDLWSRYLTARPERRVLIPLPGLHPDPNGGPIDINFEKTA